MIFGADIEAVVGVDAVETAKETVGAECVTVLGGSGRAGGRCSLECLGDEQASGPI